MPTCPNSGHRRAPLAALPRRLAGLLLAAATVGAGPVLAQSVAPGAQVTLGEIVVTATRLTPAEQDRARLEALPAATAVFDTGRLAAAANVTLSDALGAVPGVVVQDFFGGNDQPRVQVRGSGLQQNPVERGLLMLQDGIPLNRADGSYAVGVADVRQAERIEVLRGPAANRLSATVLGGAVNLVSPTGSTAPGPAGALEGGSFGHRQATLQFGGGADAVDGFVIGSRVERDGFRVYNASERTGVNGNLGLALPADLKVRLYGGYVENVFDVAGPLAAVDLEADPRQVGRGPVRLPGLPPTFVRPGPDVVRDRPQRRTELGWLGLRATWSGARSTLDVAASHVRADDTFRFPISAGVRTTDGGDSNGILRWGWLRDPAAELPWLEAHLQWSEGDARRGYALNLAGERGAEFGRFRLDARSRTAGVQLHLPFGDDAWTLSPGLIRADATRRARDRHAAPTRPTAAYNPLAPTQRLPDGALPARPVGYDRDYRAWVPSLALAWRPTPGQRVYAALARSFEPPAHDDLLATVNGTPNSSPGRPAPGDPARAAEPFRTPDLRAQRATTVELGWRGSAGRVAWDAVAYRAALRDELLSLRDATGVSLGAINADRTRHLGVELGATLGLHERVDARLAYTYQRFRFVGDPVRGGAALAGAPPHTLHLALELRPATAWSLGAVVESRPGRTPVDNLNTLYADAFTTVDLRAGWRVGAALAAFVEWRNVFDRVYASSTLVVDSARPDQAAFIPGDGRAVYLGLRAALPRP